MTAITEIQILREYFKNIYSNELEKLKEIDAFLGTYVLPNLDQKMYKKKKKRISVTRNDMAILRAF